MKFLLLLSIALLGVGVMNKASADSEYTPLPISENIRILPSAPREQVWKGLTSKEKQLAYHLFQAAKAGRNILFYQTHRHGVAIKTFLERALSRQHIGETKSYLGAEPFKEFLIYAAKFQDIGGPYAPSNRKYLLAKVSADQVTHLLKTHAPTLEARAQQEIVRLLTDKDYEVIQYPEDGKESDLAISGGNMYEKGLTGAEVTQALKAGFKSNLNCRIVRGHSGGLKCEVQALSNEALDPVVREALTGVVKNLRLASRYALTPRQKNQFKYLIKYFEEGDVEDFRKYNIEWVKDATRSKVDFMMGFVEVYQDYLNQIGSWESYVQIVDPKTTKLSVALAKNAQYFEDSMPYGVYKKKFAADYSPPALMVYYFQEIASFHSIGYNLPNFDDIRRDVGAKNIIKLDLPGEEKDPMTIKVYRQMFEEFLPANKVEDAMKYHKKTLQTLVLFHEIIGHGSGTYDTTKYGKKEDPIGALGSLGSALEEQRADLAALVFADDAKLVEVGQYPSIEEAKRAKIATYDLILADFLRRISRERTFTEAHQRGHWLFIKHLLDKGAIEYRAKDGSTSWTNENFVLAVKDYQKFWEVARDLLAELQRIKATRDSDALNKLFAEKAPLKAIEEPWAQSIIKRGEKLIINGGTVEQPWHVNVQGKLTVYGGKEPTLESIAPYWIKH